MTPVGTIEDDGDFSDFYQLPNHIDPAHRQVLQEMQDEELARLLQEQEHKVSIAGAGCVNRKHQTCVAVLE